MDMNLVMVSVVLGIIGMGMFMYGKKAGRMVPLGAGAGLMVVPYFIPNLVVLLIVGVGLMAVPWVVKE
jgi:hypothetical protein